MPSSGGISATGGVQVGTGGASLGGGGGRATGGVGTGGTSTGGVATGGVGTSGTGGVGAGGTSTGGVATGGVGTSGTGGMATGGMSTGGVGTSGTGGVGTGGVGAGGMATGGMGTGGAGDEPEVFVFGEPPVASVYFMRGINLGNRLEAPNEGDWGGTILESDFAFIAARGFDHVRIPVCFSCHALASAPYTLDASFLSRVDTVIDQALGAGLAVVIDLHAYNELAANVEGQRARFLAIWTQIAERYRDLPETVAFELLNEPYSQLDAAWNQLLADAIAAVRLTNAHRLLIADTVYWADPSRLSALTLPNDANIMTSIHLYEPKLFSFQGQSWMEPEFQTTGVIFPGPPPTPLVPVQAAQDASWAAQWFDDYNTQPTSTNPSGPATIDAQVALIESYRSLQGRTVYNGEWGPQDGGDDASRSRLIAAVRERCEAAGIGWSIWEDPQNMSLFDSSAGTWNTPLVDALLPP